jgi:hypothetical protein
MTRVNNIRGNHDATLPQGISAQEATDIFNTAIGWYNPGQKLTASQRSELVLVSEMYGKFFTAGGIARWEKLTGGIVISPKGNTYPRGYISAAEMASTKAQGKRAAKDLASEWRVTGTPNNLTVKPIPMSMASALAQIPKTGAYWQVSGENRRSRRLSWIFSRDHRDLAAKCMVHLSKQGWLNISVHIKTNPSTAYQHMWNPKPGHYR